jgi:hypothetical protein
MEMNENEGTERLIIGNKLLLSDVVVEEVGTAAPEFLAAAPFAIHIAIQ